MNRPLHVEVVQKKQSCVSKERIKQSVHSFLLNFVTLTPGATINEKQLEDDSELSEHVSSINICDVEHTSDVNLTNTEVVYHVYKLDTFGAETDTMTDATSGEELPAASVLLLPARELHGLWESLVFEAGIKEETLRFVETAFELTERGVDPNIVSCNRVVLLHGPPGTGKTSLCRALAQKLSIRLGERYSRAALVEVNAHSLFSKWFSESGKLVSRMFEKIRELLEDPRLLVAVLVDEVESLTHARRSALAGLEPSDSLRVVNAVLTQLDALKRHHNALVLTTSNVTEAIDAAFVDRADIRRWVGPPGEHAAYSVYASCCAELMRAGIVSPRERVFPLRLLEACGYAATPATRDSLALLEVARASVRAQLSGRALRKLPFLALALHAPRTEAAPTLTDFLSALQRAVRAHAADADMLAHNADARSKVNSVETINGQ